MSDIRRSILWVIFGFSLILIWDQWQIYNGNPATFFPGSSAPKASAQAPADSTVPPASRAVTGADHAVPGAEAPAPAIPRTTHTARTDVLALTFDSEGGALVGASILPHAAETGKALRDGQTPLQLLVQDAQRTYVAQTGLIGAAGTELPTHKTPMRLVSGEPVLAEGQDRLTLRFESAPVNGVVLAKTYTLQRGAYDIAVRHEVSNQGTAAVAPQVYLQLVRDGMKAESDTPFYSTFTGPAIYSDAAKYEKVEFEAIDKNKASFQKTASDGYVAMVQHYFASAWLLGQGIERENFVRKVGGLYAAGMLTPLGTVAPGETKTLESRLFVGPQEEKVLELLAPGLELVKDYGWLTILAKPLYWLLEKINGFVSNWGWSIVLLVVLIKAAFYWLNASAYRSMAKMKAINPRIMEMRERLKGNPQQMQQEMMKMYREEKVNPLGGCFPILIQIPVFIALYWVLLSSVEMRNAPWMGWIVDLSSPDPYYILPLVMALTTVFQTALNPLPPDPLQAKLMWMMPVVFSVMFFFFPAGLVLYWITNNVLTIAQQAYINHSMGVPLKFNLPKFK
ncbi:membrane protein insertase YidC [Aquabacterium sp. A08]|uniref:membrane protein insertase YidC n=1 Tax=Aquabacterium sp. A08 TaxID=2718532 RepID=UPI00142446BB|nr:membrane protein insertase YidC [Aquabacterium sp. A08]NIC42878.1 membrane protein insertase YidC [Aquabacterium sp. A08]